MTEAARERRKRLDHERYMRSREERKERQRAYYAANRERCKAKVRECQERRWLREYERLKEKPRKANEETQN